MAKSDLLLVDRIKFKLVLAGQWARDKFFTVKFFTVKAAPIK